MSKPVLIVSLIMTSTVLLYIRGITIGLQSTALDIVQASQEVHTVLKVLKNVRNKVNTYHEKWFAEAEKVCESAGSIPAVPRRCGRQKHRQNMAAGTPSSYFKRSITISLQIHHSALPCTERHGSHPVCSMWCGCFRVWPAGICRQLEQRSAMSPDNGSWAGMLEREMEAAFSNPFQHNHANSHARSNIGLQIDRGM